MFFSTATDYDQIKILDRKSRCPNSKCKHQGAYYLGAYYLAMPSTQKVIHCYECADKKCDHQWTA